MKLPLNWVRDFADMKTTPHEFAEKMTMSGSKVECFSSESDEIKNVVIAKVLKIEKHPDSDHLVVCQLDAGQETPLQIVTGAGNLKEGDLVPAALDKSRLPGGKEIRKGKLRGVASNGMLCSLGELGLTTHDFPNAVEDGILVLDETCAPGTDACAALGLDDVSVEFEITPNRPDCLSVRGLAREAAATYGVPFCDHTPQVKPGHGDVGEFLKVDIENKELCYRYIGAVVENVRVKPSPRWMRERLRLCGVRPINNLVDITNYVMLEYGQPMHCFDYKYVNGGHITVRNAKAGEKIETLDGADRTLSEEMLVIADEKGPIAVAGVMGGEFSGVYDDTTTIVFESAMFNGPSVRTTAKKLGMRTEASGRYEKGLDPNGCLRCLERALELVQLLDAGDVVNGVVDVWTHKRDKRRVPLRPEAINRLLGTALSKEEMVSILLPPGFEMESDEIVVPSDRFDVERDCDLAEEVARYVGYNKMPSTIMRGVATARPTPRQTFDSRMTEALVGFGLYEIETFSFYSPKAFDAINLPEGHPLRRAVVISNPLGEDTSIMRTTALPSMLDVVSRNINVRNPEGAFFENATEYIPAESSDVLPTENQKLLLAAYGKSWDYLAMKGVVEKLLETAGIKSPVFIRESEAPSYHPGRTAKVYVDETELGLIGELHPAVLANYKIKPRVVAADLNLDLLFACRGGTAAFKALPKFPAVTRDLALVAKEEIPAAELYSRIEKGAGKLLEKLSLFDIYRGDGVAEGCKSLAYSLVLRAPDRSLTDEDADAAVQKILKNLSEIGVVLRS
ncbi:MAG: phenylalanine--tRNA ligase subunit beta [Oscillospiraceae bacterium]|nr:phenylalanine--tRNA ligase subunit beta [Oscillospiraceae bacterium]